MLLQIAEFHSLRLRSTPLCLYTPHLDPLACWWAPGSFPSTGYCKRYCYEHWGTCLFQLVFSFFPDIYPGVGLLNYIVVIFCFEELPSCFPSWLNQFTFLPTAYRCLLFSLPAFVICWPVDDGRCGWDLIMVLSGISLMVSDAESSFMCPLAICILSLGKNGCVLLGFFIFFDWVVCFFGVEL